MALIERIGFGQVEPNHLSAQRTAQIYAQLPAAADIEILENGQFVKYDYANGKVNFDGEGEFMLVLNEVKLYDVKETCKDFRMVKENCAGGVMVPRVFKTNVGDIFTTNCIKGAEAEEGVEIAVKDYLNIGADGYLTKGNAEAEIVWKVVKVYTLADGQAAVKLQRIK